MKDAGSVLGLGRSPGEGHGNPLQYSFVLAIGHGVWELGSPTMDQIHAPCSECLATTGLPGKSPIQYSYLENPWMEEHGGHRSRG